MKDHLREAFGLLCIVLVLTLAGIFGAFGRSCQNDIQYGISGTINALKGN